MLTWHWPDDVRAYEKELAGMLAASAADDGILGYAESPSPAQREGFVSGVEQLVSGGGGHLLIGEDEEGVAAMCVMKTNSMPNCRHLAEVMKAYLDPRVRGTSAVYQLVERVCAKAEEIGVETFVIDVREDSKAHRVWSRFGFTSYGVLDDYARVDGRSYRGHYMRHQVRELAAAVAEHARKRAGAPSAG
ncbi:GNAT family N-acetyltransferase [Streptomyces roseolilacinus]|uniref:GNAT family N-acetyltransferase n=1 Tax=Streptomyces roseolilacinus TaxID=66904 RepID=UPI00167B7345|nr:GNAT family N-acetyltransferase [Streptomyces roseolilacinus]